MNKKRNEKLLKFKKNQKLVQILMFFLFTSKFHVQVTCTTHNIACVKLNIVSEFHLQSHQNVCFKRSPHCIYCTIAFLVVDSFVGFSFANINI